MRGARLGNATNAATLARFLPYKGDVRVFYERARCLSGNPRHSSSVMALERLSEHLVDGMDTESLPAEFALQAHSSMSEIRIGNFHLIPSSLGNDENCVWFIYRNRCLDARA